MKFFVFSILFFLSVHGLHAQKKPINEYASLDKKALQIPDSLTRSTEGIASYVSVNFTNDTEKARAIFAWITANIQYDAANMFAINFYEKKADKILKPLLTRKGICENYAYLFTDICSKAGLKSFVISGYTKQNGFADYIPHAWSATLLDTTWYLFDPTWGSGYVDEGVFYKKLNNAYFKVSPPIMVKSHMPFDYLWQFLPYPITNQEFYESKTQLNKSKPYFNFKDSIAAYEGLENMEQMMAASARIEKNGVKNSLIYDRLQHLKMAVEHEKESQSVELYNSAVTDYNAGINEYNAFINYRNKQFTPSKPDAEISKMIDGADEKLKTAKSSLKKIKYPNANIANMSIQLNKNIDESSKHVNEQKEWLKVYLSKNKSGRKNMFYVTKVTWFGIPLN